MSICYVLEMRFNTENYFITPLFFLLIMTTVIGIWMSILLFRKRKANGVTFLAIWTLSSAIWALTYAFEYAANNVLLKIFWSKLSYIGIAYCPVSFFFFTLAYSSRLQYLKPKYIIAAYSFVSLFIPIVLTNEFHHLHWKTVEIYHNSNTTEYTYGISFWIFYASSYFFLISGIINLHMLYFKFPKRYKSQIGIFIVATLCPILGNISYVLNINPIPGFDWTPIMFVLTGILLSINIFRFGVFDLVPFARNQIFDIMPDAVIVNDRYNRIADLNPAMSLLIGKTEKEAIGQPITGILEKWGKLITPNLQEESTTFDFETHDKYYFVQVSPIFDDNGRFSGNLTNIRDVTEQKNAENAVQEAYLKLQQEIIEKERLIVDLDAFAHTVAHDLKNMLGAIVTSASLLRMDIEDGKKDDVKEILELIELSSRKMLHTTQELLLLASVRQQEIRNEKLDMQKIIEEAIQRNIKEVKEKKVKFIKPTSYLSAIGYSSWIEDVWYNYISNAIKYGGTPPVIEFGSELVGDNSVKFWIRDNGKGIPRELQKKLFNKFMRLENKNIEGHGLGLSIVRRIVTKLNGTVGIENTEAGQGACFYFTLPSQ